MTDRRLRVLTQERFHQWLAQKHPRSLVGEAGAECNCPMVRFLKNKGYTDVMVDDYKIHINWGRIGNRTYHSPKWVTEFVQAIDKTVEPDHETRKITAGQALKILRKTLNLPTTMETIYGLVYF